MLPTIAKLMERLVNSRIEWILEDGNLLSNTQCGFRKNRTTYDQITRVENTIKKALNTKQIAIVVFIDLKGAFDRVWHNAIIFKLREMGLRGRVLGWLYSYLNNRQFKVIFEGEKSTTRNISSGVPQGSVISPLLFNVLMSDIDKEVDVSYSEYADDVAIYASDCNTDRLIEKMQQAINKFLQWTNKWGQQINIQKTKAMFFTHKRIVPDSLMIGNIPIEYTPKYKFLGMIFDGPTLSWKLHIDYLRSICSAKTAVIKSVSSNSWGSDRKALITLYTSLVRSRLDYGCHLYNLASQAHLQTLNIIQNQCIRIAIGARQTTPIISLEVEAHIPPLAIRRSFLAVKYYNRVMDYPSSSPIAELFKNNEVLDYGNTSSSLSKIRKTFREWELPLTPQLDCRVISPIPPWENNDSLFCAEFYFDNSKYIPDSAVLILCNDLIANKYLRYTQIYTDGSKDNSSTAAGLSIPSTGITMKWKLHPEMAILDAELYAILQALRWICEN